nr:MAG TPA: hypothetical protein [Caudoviricetes sp.]
MIIFIKILNIFYPEKKKNLMKLLGALMEKSNNENGINLFKGCQ